MCTSPQTGEWSGVITSLFSLLCLSPVFLLQVGSVASIEAQEVAASSSSLWNDACFVHKESMCD